MESDSKVQEQIALVIDQANHLEWRLSMLLSIVLRPVNSDYGHVLEKAMHNTVISFGSKLLLVRSILDYWSWDDLQKKVGAIDDVIRMRNAFAHTSTAKRQLHVDKRNHTVIANEMIVESKNGRKLEVIERTKAFNRFKKAYKSSLQVLSEIENRIENEIPQPGT